MPMLTSKSQVTIPKPIREHLGVAPGQAVEFIVVGDHVEVRPAKRPSAYELGKHLFGRWQSGHSDTSAERKRIINEALLAKHQRHHH